MFDDFTEYILDQLGGLENVRARKMFDAYGLYLDGRFFGIVHGGAVYFKTNEQSRGEYIAYGMEPFRPSAKQTLKNYYEVPTEILEDKDRLAEWAQAAANPVRDMRCL